jgi:hypothetical protein
VQLCAIECSYSKPLHDERNRTFREDLIGWTKVCPRVHVWEYVVNFTYPLLPHPNLRVIGPNVRFYAAQGVKGVWADGLTYGTWPVGAAEMRAWVWAKLLWNPTLDDRALMREFAEGYWGPAGKHVLASLDVFSDAVDVSGDWLGLSSPPDARFLSFATLNQSGAHLQAAEAAVAGSPEFLARVQVEQLPVLFAFLVRWNEMRDAAASRGENWPLSASIEAVWEHFRQVVEANGLPLAQNTRDDLAQAVEKAQTPWPDGAGEEAPR